MSGNNGRTKNGHKADWNGVAVRVNGRRCAVRIVNDRIVAASAVSCVWSGTARFHEWFCAQYRVLLWMEKETV